MGHPRVSSICCQLSNPRPLGHPPIYLIRSYQTHIPLIFQSQFRHQKHTNLYYNFFFPLLRILQSRALCLIWFAKGFGLSRIQTQGHTIESTDESTCRPTRCHKGSFRIQRFCCNQRQVHCVVVKIEKVPIDCNALSQSLVIAELLQSEQALKFTLTCVQTCFLPNELTY